MVPRQGRSYMLSLFLVPSPSPIIPVSNASHFLVCILQSHYHSLVPDPLGLDHASCLDLPSASHTHPPCSQSIRSKLSFSHILSPVRGFLMSIPREGRLSPLITLALQSPLHPPTASFHPMPGHATSSLGSQTLWLLCTQECPSFCVKTTLPCPQALSPQVSAFCLGTRRKDSVHRCLAMNRRRSGASCSKLGFSMKQPQGRGKGLGTWIGGFHAGVH